MTLPRSIPFLAAFALAACVGITPPADARAAGAPSDLPDSEFVLQGAAGAAQASSDPLAGDSGVFGAAEPPAWVVRPLAAPVTSALAPFGANLFQGNFSATRPDGLSPNYEISPGDQIALRIWGSFNEDATLTVDHQGNIFVPTVGPVKVAGRRHSDLQGTVKSQVTALYRTGVDVYTQLLTAQPLTVFVTGFVTRPGQYAGGPADTVFSFLDRAGGITGERGSYRVIRVLRGPSAVASIDLYDFIRNGVIDDVPLREGDVILVGERGPSVATLGLARQKARYEFPPDPERPAGAPSFSGEVPGRELARLASPLAGASHVAVAGTREGKPFSAYLTRAEFDGFALRDNDVVEFVAGLPADDMMVRVAGAVTGDSRFPVRKGTTLSQLLAHVSVDPHIADLGAIYLRRRSVATQQAAAIRDNLQRLEQTTLLATSKSPDEAGIRMREAELVQNFITRARQKEPDGVVVLMQQGVMADPALEDGDIVVIPQKSDVVLMTGEVLIPKTVAYRKGMAVKNYIDAAGGYSRRADRKNVLIVRPNGEVVSARAGLVGPGDHIMVLPRYESKNLQLVKDITQILYQIGIATRVVTDL